MDIIVERRCIIDNPKFRPAYSVRLTDIKKKRSRRRKKKKNKCEMTYETHWRDR